jgi:hypothetical protein
MSLRKQIALARKALRERPAWMKAWDKMPRQEPEPRRDPTCRHCGVTLPCGCWP